MLAAVVRFLLAKCATCSTWLFCNADNIIGGVKFLASQQHYFVQPDIFKICILAAASKAPPKIEINKRKPIGCFQAAA
jgi:hypothetical protein